MGLNKDESAGDGAGAAVIHLIQSFREPGNAEHAAKCIVKELFVQHYDVFLVTVLTILSQISFQRGRLVLAILPWRQAA